MEKKFYRRMWENVLERHFMFNDVEITEVRQGCNPKLNVQWYGMFKTYSRLIEDVEHAYFFKIINNEIKFKRIE